jgi:hypothetical protein
VKDPNPSDFAFSENTLRNRFVLSIVTPPLKFIYRAEQHQNPAALMLALMF